MEKMISIVIVSDYEGGENKTWQDEIEILQALSQQDFRENPPIYLIENEKFKGSEPSTLHEICKNLTVLYSRESQSSKLKDFGIKHTDTKYVAVFEADCQPNSVWLSSLCKTLKSNSEIDVISGKTSYGDETTYKRVLTLMDRSFDHLGAAGFTKHISNNGAIYKRDVLLKYPYADTSSPFLSARIRNKKMREEGVKFYFDPQGILIHAIGGWGFICDFRRHTGFSDMMTYDKKSVSRIPFLLWRRFVAELRDSLRLGPKALRFYDWPLWFVLTLIVPFLQISGMMDALKGELNLKQSAYR